MPALFGLENIYLYDFWFILFIAIFPSAPIKCNAGMWPFYLASCMKVETEWNETETQRHGMERMESCIFREEEEDEKEEVGGSCGTVGT